MERFFIASLAVSLGILGSPGASFGQEPVLAGIDFLTVDPGQSVEDLSGLGGMSPGCEVVGNPIIQLKGVPLESTPSCPGANLGNTSTVVQRMGDTPPLDPGQGAQVPIEIVALHLQSVEPFQVTCEGDPQEWVLDVTLSGQNQPPGQLQIFKQHPNGGTFNVTFPVRPLFTFTRVDIVPPQVVCTFLPQDHIYQGQGPWVHDPQGAPVLEIPGCTTNFFPGVIQSDLMTTSVVGFGVGAPEGFLYFFPTSSGTSDAPSPADGVAAHRILLPNAPNPFSAATTLGFAIERPGDVRLTVFNIAGQVVRTLIQERVSAGQHHVIWDGRDDDGRSVTSGLYSCEVRVGEVREIQKIALLR